MERLLPKLAATALIAGMLLAGCGPKPAPGEKDRDHAQDALDQVK